MARDFRPARVYQTAKSALAVLKPHEVAQHTPPAWLKVVEANPPTELLTRPIPIQHQPINPKARKPKKLYKPQHIVYEEDQLRKEFFKDHPWELARPRIIMEMDGLDSRRVDWSRGLRQPGLPLTGESVVQRQLWLMHNAPDMTKDKAYDQARREFYALRQEEEIERRIAQEEARMVGAYFGKSRLQVGMDLEDKEFEKWKAWAMTENAKIEAQRSSMITTFGDESASSEDPADPELEKIE